MGQHLGRPWLTAERTHLGTSGNRRDATGHPGLLHGYEAYADSFALAHVPGSGYYLAEEQPDAVIRHIVGFLTGV